MKKLSLSFVLFALVTVSTVFIACQTTSKTANAKLLKFNLEQGKGYDYELVWDMDTKVAGQETAITMTGLYTMDITGIDEKVRSVTTAYKRIKMDMNVMGMNLTMDSEAPPTAEGEGDGNPLGMMNKVMTAIVGKKFVIKADEEGNILEVTGFEKIINDMIDSMGLEPSAKAQVDASMKDQFSEQSIKDQFAPIFTIFPNKEVKVGDTWDKSFSTGGKMAAKHTTTYTVKEIDGDHVTLSANTKIASKEEDGQQISGSQTGKIIVDSKSGLMINAEFDQDIEVKAEGQTVAVKGKGRIRGTAR